MHDDEEDEIRKLRRQTVHRNGAAPLQHAGIGLDYVMDTSSMARYLIVNAALYGDGAQFPTDGRVEFTPPSILPKVAEELLRRGYSAEHVRGILGENYLGVLDANH
jgi:microsomal dipeptidase-like Zn-dependent dipeptidase